MGPCSLSEQRRGEDSPFRSSFRLSPAVFRCFLILAASFYESWSLAFSGCLSTPVAVFVPFRGLCGSPARAQAGVFYPRFYMVQIENRRPTRKIGVGHADSVWPPKNAMLIIGSPKEEYEMENLVECCTRRGKTSFCVLFLMTSICVHSRLRCRYWIATAQVLGGPSESWALTP